MDEIRERAGQLRRIIDECRGEIEQRWLARVLADIDGAPEVELTHLRDGMPQYLAALSRLLAGPPERMHSEARSSWLDIAREHGITRVRIGFDITQLVHEFTILRQVILDLLRARGAAVVGAYILLVELLDVAIVAALQAYVDARDMEVRRRQARQVAFVTHELRNPLTTAVSATGLLEMAATPDQRSAIGKLQRSHRALAELIDSVLLTQQIESGEVKPRPIELTLGELLEPAIEAARATALRKSLTLRTSYDPARRLRLDPVLTRSAIQNLVVNAVKYTDVGNVQVQADERDGNLEIHVRDNCGGLSDEELRTIFEPFKRGDSRRTGSGLGLAIARRAIEAQGGTIEAESPGPVGCHFWIKLPARAE